MAYFRLLNKSVARRSLGALARHLVRSDTHHKLPRLVDEMPEGGKRVKVPGFDAQALVGNLATLKVLFAKPHSDVSEFLGIYDSFVQKASVGEGLPGPNVAGVYQDTCDAHKVLGKFRLPEHWYSIGLILGLISQRIGGEAHVSDDTLHVWLGPSSIRVSPLGCWNNELKDFETLLGGDFDFPATTFPAIDRDEIIVKALSELTDTPASRNALNILAHCLEEEITTVSDVAREFLMPGGLLAKALLGEEAQREHIRAALDGCLLLLSSPPPNLLRHLSTTAVPTLMSFAEFVSHFGVPSQASPTRVFRPFTLTKWRKIFDRYAERALSQVGEDDE